MPQAVIHILIPIIILSLFRDFIIKDRQKFPSYYLFIGGIAGILPDIDIAIYYVLSFFGFTLNEVHRTFSHNFFVVVFFLFLGSFFYNTENAWLGKHHLKLNLIFFVIAFGISIHLVLDFLFVGMIIPFYPFSDYEIGLNLFELLPLAWQETITPSLDAALLVLWLIYVGIRRKIKNFI